MSRPWPRAKACGLQESNKGEEQHLRNIFTIKEY